MTTTNLSYFNAAIWKPRLEYLLSSTIVHTCTNKNYEGEIKNQGDQVKLSENQNLIISEKKFFAFKVDNVAQVQANTDIMDAHLTNAKRVIQEVEENYLLSMHKTVDVKNIFGSENEPVELTTDNIYLCFAQLAIALNKNNIYDNNLKAWVIINPNIEAYLLQSSEFIPAHNITDQTLRKGAIGRIAGLDVLVSTNLTDVDDKYYVLAGTNDAITFASQLAKIESLRDKDSFSNLVRGLYLYGAKTVQPKALAKMIIKA